MVTRAAKILDIIIGKVKPGITTPVLNGKTVDNKTKVTVPIKTPTKPPTQNQAPKK